MKTLDQERAAFSWSKITNFMRKATKKERDEFLRIAQGAPSLIMSNGLMQALAFYKQKDDAKDVLNAVLDWVGTRVLGQAKGSSSFDSVMQGLVEADADTYFRATEEALAILKWIRHFAKAKHAESKDRDDQSEAQR